MHSYDYGYIQEEAFFDELEKIAIFSSLRRGASHAPSDLVARAGAPFGELKERIVKGTFENVKHLQNFMAGVGPRGKRVFARPKDAMAGLGKETTNIKFKRGGK